MNTQRKEEVIVRKGPVQRVPNDQGTEGNREPWRDTHLWGGGAEAVKTRGEVARVRWGEVGKEVGGACASLWV